MTDEQNTTTTNERTPHGVDKVAVLYILGGIPAIVGFVVVLFTLVQLFPNLPA